MTSRLQAAYLPDTSVDDALDLELRALLSTCFRKPEDWVFRERRYFREPYPHRWVIRTPDNAIMAHMGVHGKEVEADGRRYPIAGIGDVCVHPDLRGHGFVRRMLETAHTRLPSMGFVFAVLFGDPKVYGSSGYREVGNLFIDDRSQSAPPARKQTPGMVRELTRTPWPSTDVLLIGLKF